MFSAGKNKISRRSFIGSVGAASACSGLGVVSSAEARGAGSGCKRATAFALVGDRFHNSDYIRSALGKTLVREAGLSIDFTNEVTVLNSENLRNYRMLIVFRDAVVWPMGYGPNHWWGGYHIRPDNVDSVKCVKQDWYPGYKKLPPLEIVSVPPVPDYQAKPVCWMTEEQGLAVKKFVEGGGAAFFYHNAPYIATENRYFREVLGASTMQHPPIRPFKVKVVNPNHPIMRGGQRLHNHRRAALREVQRGSERHPGKKRERRRPGAQRPRPYGRGKLGFRLRKRPRVLYVAGAHN